jgi:hypothetical protein
MQVVLNVVDNWTANEGLSISPQKRTVVPFTNSRKLEGLGFLTLRDMQLQMLQEVKYPAVTLTPNLDGASTCRKQLGNHRPISG